MSTEVLFIDDEPFFAKPYIQELEKQFTVHFRDSAEDGRLAFEENAGIRCLILDIMMPPPREVSLEATGDGLDTGLWMLAAIREHLLERKVPVLILTNRLAHHVEESVDQMDFPPAFVEVRSKIETPRFYLPHAIQKLIERARHL